MKKPSEETLQIACVGCAKFTEGSIIEIKEFSYENNRWVENQECNVCDTNLAEGQQYAVLSQES